MDLFPWHRETASAPNPPVAAYNGRTKEHSGIRNERQEDREVTVGYDFPFAPEAALAFCAAHPFSVIRADLLPLSHYGPPDNLTSERTVWDKGLRGRLEPEHPPATCRA